MTLVPPAAGPVLIAVSGGADSTALALMLADARVAPLALAHVRHGFRPDDAGRDLECVRELADRIAAPLHVLDLEPPPGFRRGDKIPEGAARSRRYAALSRLARELDSRVVAVGHHASDQTETRLLHLLRGGALRGLAGMREVRPIGGGVLLWRPLLAADPDELRRFLSARGLRWSDDPSNLDLRLARNRARHELLPLLRARSDAWLAAETRLGARACAALDRIEGAVARLAAEGKTSLRERCLVFERARIAALAPALLHHWIEAVARRLDPEAGLGRGLRRHESEQLCGFLRRAGASGRRLVGTQFFELGGRWLCCGEAGLPEPSIRSRIRLGRAPVTLAGAVYRAWIESDETSRSRDAPSARPGEHRLEFEVPGDSTVHLVPARAIGRRAAAALASGPSAERPWWPAFACGGTYFVLAAGPARDAVSDRGTASARGAAIVRVAGLPADRALRIDRLPGIRKA